MLLLQQEDSSHDSDVSPKELFQGELAVVPCPFRSEQLVELDPRVQDDALQVMRLLAIILSWGHFPMTIGALISHNVHVVV